MIEFLRAFVELCEAHPDFAILTTLVTFLFVLPAVHRAGTVAVTMLEETQRRRHKLALEREKTRRYLMVAKEILGAAQLKVVDASLSEDELARQFEQIVAAAEGTGARRQKKLPTNGND